MNDNNRAIFFSRSNSKWGAFSNFSKFTITYGGNVYKTSENLFQACKCIDPAQVAQFAPLEPGAAKKLGRRVQLRSDWEQVKVNSMLFVLRLKAEQNPEWRKLLLESGTRLLVENTTGWNDNCWGRAFNCVHKLGKNYLGLCLMRVRAEQSGNPMITFASSVGDIEMNIIENFDELVMFSTNRAINFSKNYDWLYKNGCFE